MLSSDGVPTVVVDSDGSPCLFGGFREAGKRSRGTVAYVEQAWLFDQSGELVAVTELVREAEI